MVINCRFRLLYACIFVVISSITAIADVNPDGSFSHSIQIKIPDGARGVQPALSLVYNSNQRNGIAGSGWSLTGFPYVTRDNSFQLNYGGNDRFIGPNGRLIKVDDYYHHEEENYSRLEASEATASGPFSWIEYKPDGTRFFYGTSENSRIYAIDRPGAVRVWALEKVQDIHGNSYSIEYTHDRGQYYPSHIIYTIGKGISHKRIIEFEYEERPDPEITFDQSTSVITALRLKWIIVRSGVTSILGTTFGGELVRKYHLDYFPNDAIHSSRLMNVQEFGSDGGQLPPVVFDYDIGDGQVTFTLSSMIPSSGFTTSQGTWHSGDINGDGKLDLIQFGPKSVITYESNEDGTFTTLGGNYTPWSGYKTGSGEWFGGDFDGDRKTDFFHIVSPVLSSSYAHVWISNGDGTFSVSPFSPGNKYPVGKGKWISADINGDGITDMLHLYLDGSGDYPLYFNSWISNGEGIFTKKSINLKSSGIPKLVLNTLYYANKSAEHLVPVQSGDITGDGMDDFIIAWFGESPDLPHVTIYTLISKGNGEFNVGSYRPKNEKYIDRIASNNVGRPGVHFLTGDFNGDGLTDILLGSITNTRSYVLLSKGDGTYQTELSCADGTGYDSGKWNVVDFNGDGKSDIIHCVKKRSTPYRAYIWLSNGSGNFFIQKYSIPSGYPVTSGLLLAGNFKGNSNADLVHIQTSGNKRINFFANGIADSGLITSIRDGMGGMVQIKYTPAAGVQGAIQPSRSSFPYVTNNAIRHLVTATTSHDGRGSQIRTEYDYWNGMTYSGFTFQRKDLLFEMVTGINVATGGNERTTTGFMQSDRRYKGCPVYAEHYNKNGALVKRVDYQYYDNPATCFGTYRAFIHSTSQTNYESGAIATVGIKEYIYDDYGNIIRSDDHATNTETISVLKEYDIDKDGWIISRLSKSITMSNSLETERRRFIYSNNNLTQSDTFFATEGRWITQSHEYDDIGNAVMTTDPLGNVTHLYYDDEYRMYPIRRIIPLGHVVSARYDHRFGLKLSETDENGNTTRYEHDQFGRATRMIQPGDEWTTETVYYFTGDADTQYIETRVKDDSEQGYHYKRRYFDGMGREYRIVQKANESNGTGFEQVVETRFNSNGQKESETIPYLIGTNDEKHYSINYSHDECGRLQKIAYPDGYIKSISYFALGNGRYAESFTDNRDSRREYIVIRDARGRVVEKLEPNNVRILYTYNNLGLISSLRNTDGLITRVGYDSLGRKRSVDDPNSGTSLYEYDDVGRLISSRDAKGNIVSYRYDEIGRILEIDHPVDTPDTRYYYDDTALANGIGKITKIDDGVSVSTFAYDKKGRPTVKTQAIDGKIFSFRMEYDSVGRVKRLTYPDGTVIDRDYCTMGTLKSVSWDGHPIVRYGRFKESQVDEIANMEHNLYRLTGDGIESKIIYNPKTGKPTRIISRKEGGTGSMVEDINYGYNDIGNVEAITDNLDPSKTQKFEYDDLGRIVSAQGIQGNLRYRYLNNGNMIQKGELRLEYDSTHPYAVSRDSEGNRYEYDTNGNLTRRGESTLAYDALNRLVAISHNGAVTASYAYDHANNRVRKETSDGVIMYNADRLYEIAVLPGGEQHTKFFYGINNELVAQMSVENATLAAHDDPGIISATYAWDNPRGLILCSYRYLNYLVHDRKTYRSFAAAIILLFIFGLIILIVHSIREGDHRKHTIPSWAVKTAPLLCVCVFGSFGILGCSNFLDHDTAGVPPWIMAFPHGGDGPVKPPPGMFFFHPDYNTNISYITDHRGEIVSKLHYKPYGEIALKTGSDPAYHKFNSHRLDDESGLYYYNARYYDPHIGRFITPDTIVPDPGNSQSLNRYMYVEGNPITLNDPSGSRPSWQIDFYAEQLMSNWKQQADRQPDNVLTQMCKSLLNSAFFGMISLIDGGGWSFLAHWVTNFANIPEFNLSYSYSEGWGITAGATYNGCGGGSHWQQRGPNKGFSQWGTASISYKSFSIGLTTSFNFNKHTMTNSLRVSLSGRYGGVGLGYTWVNELKGMKLVQRGMTGFAGVNISGIIGQVPTKMAGAGNNDNDSGPDGNEDNHFLTRYRSIRFLTLSDLMSGISVFGFQESGKLLSENTL
ncbi:MAG: hypothetical protein E4G96_00455, partial [Chrysiogenales bacterium]